MDYCPWQFLVSLLSNWKKLWVCDELNSDLGLHIHQFAFKWHAQERYIEMFCIQTCLIFEKCLQQYWCWGMVLNLKYAKSVKACQLRYWHLRHYYFTPLTFERRKYLGIFGRWRQTTFVHFAIKLNVSRFENNSHDLFLWYFGNTVPTSVPDMSTQNIWYRILELSLSSKAQNYL